MARVGVLEAAARLGFSADTVRRRLRAGTLTAQRDNKGQWWIEVADAAVTMGVSTQILANHLPKLVLPLLLISRPVWAERLPVPPVPPTRSSPVKSVQVSHRGSPSSAKAVLSRRTPIAPNPHATTQLATPAPVPDRDARPPPDPDLSLHTKVTPTDFRPPAADTDAAFPYGSRFRSPQDRRPIQIPGFTVTIPLRLP
jgi:hypothetical protein